VKPAFARRAPLLGALVLAATIFSFSAKQARDVDESSWIDNVLDDLVHLEEELLDFVTGHHGEDEAVEAIAPPSALVQTTSSPPLPSPSTAPPPLLSPSPSASPPASASPSLSSPPVPAVAAEDAEETSPLVPSPGPDAVVSAVEQVKEDVEALELDLEENGVTAETPTIAAAEQEDVGALESDVQTLDGVFDGAAADAAPAAIQDLQAEVTKAIDKFDAAAQAASVEA